MHLYAGAKYTNENFVWSREQKAVFQLFKIRVPEASILTISAKGGRWLSCTDASKFAMGTGLMQVPGDAEEGDDQVVA